MIASNTHHTNVIPTAIQGVPGLSTLVPMSRTIRNGIMTSSWSITQSPTRITCTVPSTETASWSTKRSAPPQNVKVARPKSHQVTRTRLTNVLRLVRTRMVGTLRTLVQ